MIRKKRRIKSFSVDTKTIKSAAKKYSTFRISTSNKQNNFIKAFSPSLVDTNALHLDEDESSKPIQRFEDVSQRLINVNKLYKSLKKEVTIKEKEKKFCDLLENRFKKVRRLSMKDFKAVVKNMSSMNDQELKRLEFDLFHKDNMVQRRQEMIKKGVINEDTGIKDFYLALFKAHPAIDKGTKKKLNILSPTLIKKKTLKDVEKEDSDGFEMDPEKLEAKMREEVKQKRYKNFVPFTELLKQDETQVSKFLDRHYVHKKNMKSLIQEYLKSNRSESFFLKQFMTKRNLESQSRFFREYSKQKSLQQINYRNMTIKTQNSKKLDDSNEGLEITKVSDLVKRRVLNNLISLEQEEMLEKKEMPSYASRKTLKRMKNEDSVRIVVAWMKEKKDDYLAQLSKDSNTKQYEPISPHTSKPNSVLATPMLTSKSKYKL